MCEDTILQISGTKNKECSGARADCPAACVSNHGEAAVPQKPVKDPTSEQVDIP